MKTLNDIELKHCPFCGNKGRFVEVGMSGQYFMGGQVLDGYAVQCTVCRAKTESFSCNTYILKGVSTGKLRAARAWNMRPNEGTSACPECGVDVPHTHRKRVNEHYGIFDVIILKSENIKG